MIAKFGPTSKIEEKNVYEFNQTDLVKYKNTHFLPHFFLTFYFLDFLGYFCNPLKISGKFLENRYSVDI